MKSKRGMSKTANQDTQKSALDPLKGWFHSGMRDVPRKQPEKQRPVNVLSVKTLPVEARRVKARPHKAGAIFHGLGLPPFREGLAAKEIAVSLLRAGAEIEHSLAIQYLYAAYSIDETSEKSGSVDTMEWKAALRLIAREEMAHLVTVQNLLLTVGEPPHLNRGPLHRKESKLPLPFELECLDSRALGKFVLFECPAPDQLSESDLKTVIKVRQNLGRRSRVLRVGSIYAAVYWLFMESDTPGANWPFPIKYLSHFARKKGYLGRHLKDSDFISHSKYEDKAAVAKEWGIFEASTHVDGASPRETALASLRWIMTQGEGPNAIEESHFCRFLKIYEEFISDEDKFDALILKVPTNPRVVQPQKSGQPDRDVGTLIGNPGTKRWATLFNLRYRFMLLNIRDSLEQSRKSGARKRRTLAQWAVAEMVFLQKIGQALPRMDLHKQKKKKRKDLDHKGPVAGAPFQLRLLLARATEREKMRREMIEESGRCVSELRDGKFATSVYTGHAPTAADVPGLLDSIARQDDEMWEALQ
jgi:hypothetical protein